MQNHHPTTTAIILAAGMGSRMNLGYNKIFYNFKKPLICYTIEAFERTCCVDEIIIVSAENEVKDFEKILAKHSYQKVSKIVIGGKTRQDSSRLGVENSKSDFVILHDGARPFISPQIIDESVKIAKETRASIVAVPCKDTLKLAGNEKVIEKTLDRSLIWMAQTPQVFQRDLILKAHQKAFKDNFVGTDEASLVERIGEPVSLIMGSYDNIKVTTEEDLLLAELIINKYSL